MSILHITAEFSPCSVGGGGEEYVFIKLIMRYLWQDTAIGMLRICVCFFKWKIKLCETHYRKC